MRTWTALVKKKSCNLFFRLTPLEGSPAQACLHLFSGSRGSSRTKPFILYLEQWLSSPTPLPTLLTLSRDYGQGLQSSLWFPHQEFRRLHTRCEARKNFLHLWQRVRKLCLSSKPGTISAVSVVSLSVEMPPPSRTMELGWDAGVQATCRYLFALVIGFLVISVEIQIYWIHQDDLMAWKCVQLVLPGFQDMQVSGTVWGGTDGFATPPQTTRVSPDRSETVCRSLGWGRSGMMQALGGGRGNTSTLERLKVVRGAPEPPNTTWPEGKVINITFWVEVWRQTTQIFKNKESEGRVVYFDSYLGIGLELQEAQRSGHGGSWPFAVREWFVGDCLSLDWEVCSYQAICDSLVLKKVFSCQLRVHRTAYL